MESHRRGFFDEGVGAEGNWWHNLLGGTSGLGLYEKILECYKFLVENHQQQCHGLREKTRYTSRQTGRNI